MATSKKKSSVIRIGFDDANEIKRIRAVAIKEFKAKGVKGKNIVSESEAFEVYKHVLKGRIAVIRKKGVTVYIE